jgi:tetratricopeptide (TPR) repeat protein
MIAGLFAGAVLCAAADPTAAPPRPPDGHKDALARYGAAVWNLRRERLLTAAGQLDAAAKGDPDAAEPLKDLARLYAQLGREPEAIRVARRALDRDPDDGPTAVLLARLLLDAGEPAEAAKAARLAARSKTLTDRPDRAVRTCRELAALCERCDDPAGAEAALRRAVELLTDGRAAVVAARALTPKEADAEAADCLERLGKVLVKRKKYEPAAEAFAAAAKLYADPKRVNDPAAAARLGWNLSGALEAKGDPEAALAQLETFLAFRPQAVEPYRRLAALYRALGRGDRAAAEELRRYARLDEANRPLAAVLAAELARTPATRADADALFAKLTAETADPAVIAVVVRSHVDTSRAGEIVKDLDRAFTVLEGKDQKEDEKKDEPPKGADDVPAEAAEKALRAAADKALKEAADKEFAAEKVRAYADVLAHDPAAVSALLYAAEADLQAGTKRAFRTYYFLGELAARHGQLELAKLQFRQAVTRAPLEVRTDAYRALFVVLQRAKRPKEIEELCAAALAPRELFRSDAFFNYYLARALADQGKEREAIEAADKSVQQPGGNQLWVRLNRHHVLCVLGKWDAAIGYGQKLLDEFDAAPADRAAVRHAQAQAYWGAKRAAESEALYRAILDDDPDDAGACNDLGFHLADQGRNLDEAERLVRHALAVDRLDRRRAGSAEADNASYRDSLAWVLFRQGKLAAARAELEAAVALPEGAAHAEIWDHLGDVLFRLNDKAKAKAAWEKAQALYAADGRATPRGRIEEVKRKLQRVPPEK